MAIQQAVPIQLQLVGDGVSTVFSFAVSKLFELSIPDSNQDFITNHMTNPDAVAMAFPPQVFPNCTPTIDSYGNVILTFDTAPANGAIDNIQIFLYYNSGKTVSGNLLIPNTLSFSGTVAPVVASQYSPVLQYTIPAGRILYPTSFRSLSATAGHYSALVCLCDFGAYNLGTKAFTNKNQVTQPRFMFNMFTHATTALSGSTTVTATYVNQDGVTGRTATATLPASSVNGARINFVLQAGDTGVMDVTAVSNSGTPTGTVEIYGVNTIAYHVNSTASVLTFEDFPIQQTYVAGDIISLEIFATTTTAAHREVEATFLMQ